MGKRVLLIEDEPNIIEAISFILSRDGYTVHTHEDGITAMELTARGQTKDRDLAMRLGATEYMTKPFSNSEVRDYVRATIGA